MQGLPPPAVRWLVAANAVWLLAGLVDYATPLTMMVGAALAAAVALPGLLALRRVATGPSRLWLDRAMSAGAGTWTLLLVLVVLPLLTLEEGGNLWASRGYWALTLVVANGGFLLLNLAAYRAIGGPTAAATARTYALFHAALLVGALYFLATTDHARVAFDVGDQAMEALDLRLAPAFAAVPGVTWALAFWRSPPVAGTQASESPA